jgi:hypothetical protein
MPKPEFRAKALRRTVWELVELAEEDRAWILGELSPADRARLIELMSEAEGKTNEATVRTNAPDFSGLDDWLYLRALAALDPMDRSAVYGRLPMIKRWWISRKVERLRARSEMTPTASVALLDSIREVRVGGTL